MTTTQIRFLLTVEDSIAVTGDQRGVDENIQRLLATLHELYVEYTLNPFSGALNGAAPIRSERFDRKVDECVSIFNRTARRWIYRRPTKAEI